jgi:hypothetical protein
VEGFAFELNNRAAHKVSNLSPVERVHAGIDCYCLFTLLLLLLLCYHRLKALHSNSTTALHTNYVTCPYKDTEHHDQRLQPIYNAAAAAVCVCSQVEGFAFELNNRAAHKVSNLSPVERVHVVFDLCEEPHPRINVPPGTVCDYDMEQGLLCK